ncbi:unnamed protein product [Camellia sinensis]
MSSLPVQISNPLLDNHFSMSEYFTGIADWDSQAVARSCTNAFSTSTFMNNNPQTYLAPMTIQQDHDFLLNTFPDLFETPTVLDELDQLFYPMFNPLAQQTILSSSSSSVSFSKGETEQEKEAHTRSPCVVAAATTARHEAKYKRRKNQHKRVVLQVTAGVSSDTWAWRKYGQKPIKGSPYPSRSYYRCSSSKGCLARKHVEQSLSDPEMFVITYTAEHCHDHPTRRNSLAGTTRHKFSTSTPKISSTTAAANHNTPSPPSPSLALATMEEELSRQRILKKENREEEEEEEEEDEHNGLDIYDMILNDDFLMGFDEPDRLTFGLQEAYNGNL